MLLGKNSVSSWFETIQKWWFWREKQRSRETTKKVWRQQIVQTLLDEDDSQTQQKLVEQLTVMQKASLFLWKLWERCRKWENGFTLLNDRQQTNRKTTWEVLLTRYKRKWQVMKNGYILGILSIIYHRWIQANPSLQDQIVLETRQCLVGSGGCHLLWAAKPWRNC